MVEVAKTLAVKILPWFTQKVLLRLMKLTNACYWYSSGASAPEILVDNFLNSLKEKYEVGIEEVEIIKENIVFKIPKKLN